MTIKRYLDDPALTGVAEVVELVPGERPIVRLRDTWFHPQGGGQKGDRGTLGPVDVLDVRYGAEKTIDHYVSTLDGLEVGASYPFAIDADWRLFNTRLHSAGHLLSGVAEDLFPGKIAVAGHHWEGECRVDFEGVDLERIVAGTDAIEAAANRDIAAGMPIAIIGGTDSRAVAVGEYRPIGCGGTHVTSAAELGGFKVRSIKLKGSMVRVGYDLTDARNDNVGATAQ